MSEYEIKPQRSRRHSPWSWQDRALMVLWSAVWLLLFRPTPKFFSPWRVWLLQLFGAKVRGRPFVSESARVKIPWNLTLNHRACLGPFCDVYNLGPVELRARCTVTRHVAICGGSHDLSTPRLPLVVAPVVIGPDAFIGSHAYVNLGVHIGEGAVVGARGVVVKDVAPWEVVAGNPCRKVGERSFDRKEARRD